MLTVGRWNKAEKKEPDILYVGINEELQEYF